MNHQLIGRKEEIKRLSTDFIFQTNVVLLAPQGWGKTSIVKKASSDAAFKENKFRFCHVELSNVREEERFYELLSEGVIKAISSSLEDVVKNIGRYFKTIIPKLTFSTPDVDGIRLSFDWNELRLNKEYILDLPYRIAQEEGLKITVCLDDFHEVAEYRSSEEFLESLTGRWQKHAGVSYCLCASELPVMRSVMKSPVFSRYGDVVRLGRVSTKDYASYLKEIFADNGKFLDIDNAELIISLVEGHPFYVTRLSAAALASTSVVCSREVVENAHRFMLEQMHLAFTQITYSITSQQLCYLHAVLSGETVISKSEVLHRHGITSATSATRSKSSLMDSGIICQIDGKLNLADPVYAYWLKYIYFNHI